MYTNKFDEMFRCFLRLLILFNTSVFCSLNLKGSLYPPTKGAVWPKPQSEMTSYNYYVLKLSLFNVKIIDHSCNILINALERYNNIFHKLRQITVDFPKQSPKNRTRRRQDIDYNGYIKTLKVKLNNECDLYPYYNMNEKYSLNISASSELTSNTIWGILRGLETFTQLIYLTDDYSELRINATFIKDFPKYKHRGLLIDTARHFLSLSSILKTLDAMAMNKMNVLHWHIVDDQSFPYESDVFPLLSEKGSYYPSMVYTKLDIQYIIDYARDRGIRILPEFDTPGHTRSWGESYPNFLTECYQKGQITHLGPMNPIKEDVYGLLQMLFQEVSELFPDRFLHLGGDEVDLSCWRSNPKIRQYLRKNEMNVNELYKKFINNTFEILPRDINPIVWQEAYDEGAVKSTVHVQVWKDGWVDEMTSVTYELRTSNRDITMRILLEPKKGLSAKTENELLNAGQYVIFSATWYLDFVQHDWESFYVKDPRHMVYEHTKLEDKLHNIVGGEACMWGEKVDDTNLFSRTWPRTSAVAERLWTGIDYKNLDQLGVDLNRARYRIEEHVCRMKRRDIPAQPPSGPGYCVGAPF